VSGPELEADIVAHLAAHGKIDAIKLYRQRTGAGIKEANDVVSDIASRRGL
jgi:ribosomal protein L7/L12